MSTKSGLSDTDRRIIGCLQIEPRVSWRRVSEVIGVPERTVARRGAQLLAARIVVVTGLAAHGESILVRARCADGMARTVARSLAQRDDVTFSYVVTGSTDCVAELICPPHALTQLLLDELPGIPGIEACSSEPILRYFRTVAQWEPVLLTDDEAAALRGDVEMPAHPEGTSAPVFDNVERLIVNALRQDGRCTTEELARVAGVSESTARRRVDELRGRGHIVLRSVIEPAAIGLPVEAMLWVRTAPQHVGRVGEALTACPEVRYVAATMGAHQIVVDVAVSDKAAMYGFLASHPWLEHVTSVESSLVVAPLKRSGVAVSAHSRV